MQKLKNTRKLGKTLQISAYKLAIANGLIPHGMSALKANRIKCQVNKMKNEQLNCSKYQPFTSKASKRKPKQVGA